jgi:hypothetical protein
MNKTDLMMEVEGINKLLDSLMEKMSEARKDEANAKIYYEHKNTGFQELSTNLMVDIANRPDIKESVDPRTGKANADWAKILTQQAMIGDPVFQKISEELYQARDVYYLAQSDAQDVADQIGTVRTKAILVSSLLRYMAAVDEDI